MHVHTRTHRRAESERMMSMNDAILLAAIGLMLYGIAQHFIQGDGFWLSPIGNIIGAIAIALVAGAAYPLALQDEGIVFVAVALGLYWFTKRKTTKKPATKQSFEQVFKTVEVEPLVEPKVKAEPVVEDEHQPAEPLAPEASPVFVWKGA